MELQRLDDDLFTLTKDGILYGTIFSSPDATGMFNACFWPPSTTSLKTDTFCGTLAECKDWLEQQKQNLSTYQKLLS